MKSWKDIAFLYFKKRGIKDGEIYVKDVKNVRVEYRNGEIETLKEENEKGAGIRIINDKKLGFSYTSSLLEADLSRAIESAFVFSKFTTENPHYTLMKEDLPPTPVNIFDPQIPELGIDEMISYARRIEEAARKYDERIKDFRTITVEKGYGDIAILNTYGIFREYSFTFIYFLVELISEEGNEREMGFEIAASPFLTHLSPEDVGIQAAYKAISKLGGKIYNTGKFPVVFNPEAEAELLSALFPAFSGENVMKGKSIYRDMIGEKIASDIVTLVNDGTLANGLSTSPFDDEGIPTKRVEVISKGVLGSYLHNLYSATFFNTESTGSGFRANIKNLPGIRPSNLHILPGNVGPKDIISNLSLGIYVTSVIGAHTINPVSGDFSVGITGNLIEKGEITYPVKGMTIAGNIRDLLKGVKLVANDLKFFPQGVGGSTVLVEGLSIGGK